MGNRAHVIFPEARVAVYLHWNGGLESVVSFLDYMNERKLAADDYGAARFCQIVGNYFGGNHSLGVRGMAGATQEHFRAEAYEDNGAFVVERGEGGLRVGQWFEPGPYLNATAGRGPARKVDAVELVERIEAARRHAYNADGAMLADIRAKNGPAAAEEA